MNYEQLSIPLKDLIAAYEANFIDEQRQVLCFTMASCKPKMKKWIIEYAVTYRNQQGEVTEEALIGKIFSDPAKGTASYRLMQHLWVNGMNDQLDYTIVRPIAYLPSYNLLLMSKAPGQMIQSWLFETKQAVHASYQIALWLIQLHNVPLMHTHDSRIPRAETDLTRLLDELIVAVPNKAAALKSFIDRLLRHSLNEQVGSSAMLHGDFHIKNVFWDGMKVTAIDFDHHFIGDKAWDVSYHACQMQLSAFYKKGDFYYFQPAIKTLIDTYVFRIPEAERASFLERLSYYRARSLFESLHYEICVCKTSALHIIDPLLKECEMSLQGKGFL